MRDMLTPMNDTICWGDGQLRSWVPCHGLWTKEQWADSQGKRATRRTEELTHTVTFYLTHMLNKCGDSTTKTSCLSGMHSWLCPFLPCDTEQVPSLQTSEIFRGSKENVFRCPHMSWDMVAGVRSGAPGLKAQWCGAGQTLPRHLLWEHLWAWSPEASPCLLFLLAHYCWLNHCPLRTSW